MRKIERKKKQDRTVSLRSKGESPTEFKLRMLRGEVRVLEDRLILQNNRIVSLEQNRHENIQRLVEASISELRQAGKFKCSKCNR